MATQVCPVYSQDASRLPSNQQGADPGFEALKTIARNPGLIFLDIVAPQVSGADALGMFKKAFAENVTIHMLNYAPTPESRVSSQIASEIDQLKAGKEDEATPTDFAYQSARALIQSAYRPSARVEHNVPRIMPIPWVTTDDAGGIRMLWSEGPRKLRVNIGANEHLRTYLYHESGIEHAAEPLTPDSLNRRLTWLTER